MMTEPIAPEISVIVPTHDRRDSVLRLLAALGSGGFPADRFEVIVVCDGCGDATVTALSDLATPFRLLVLAQTPARGAASARNLGARRASGAVFAFIDDDIEPLPTLLEAHARVHRDALGDEPVVVVGAPLPVRHPHASLDQIAVWGWWEQQFERMSQADHRFTYSEVFSGVLSMAGGLFATAGGFDAALNSCRDDSEFGLRLIRMGARVVFSREGGGHHHEIRNHAQLVARKRAEGRADVLLARRHPELWPDLRLATGESGWFPARALRGLAMYAPLAGDVLERMCRIVLWGLQRLRLRGTWRALRAATLYYAYWRGAREALGSPRAARRRLDRRRDAAHRAERDTHLHEIELDLSAGLPAAEAELDRQRPHSARVRFGDAIVGHIAPVAGAEPLRGAHLRSYVSGEGPFAADLALALTLRDMRRVASARRAAAVEPQLAQPVRASAVRAQLAVAQLRFPPRDPATWPPVSVVVCTKDRTPSLAACLTSLAQLDYPTYEVVVVDNASATSSTRYVTAKFPARYVREDRPGLDWARNRGIAEARHAIIAFTDDDVRVDTGWLRGIARGFTDPDVMLVTGLIAPAALTTPAETTFEFAYGGMGKSFTERRWDPEQLDADELLGAHELGAGANMAFRRAVFEKVGAFDTALDVGTPSHGAGDLDMFHRVLASGCVACYQPDALVWHQRRRDLTSLQRQLRDNGRSFGAYLLTRWAAARRGIGPVTPRQVLHYAVHVWLGWRVLRVVRRLLRRDALALPLQAAELEGVLQAPWAYLATRRNDKRVRESGQFA